jgi:hypothetical protein
LLVHPLKTRERDEKSGNNSTAFITHRRKTITENLYLDIEDLGRVAKFFGKKKSDNPFQKDGKMWKAWNKGYSKK